MATRELVATGLDREAFIRWYERNRQRSRALFDLIDEDAYYSQPIALRHPIVFYEGHLAAFSFNTLVKRALGGPSIDERFERLFARGIDPDEEKATPEGDPRSAWPERGRVREFSAAADQRVLESLAQAEIERPGDPYLDRGEAVFTILEHEAMHQETLMYMWHRLPLAQKRMPPTYRPVTEGAVPPLEWVNVPAGRATLGVDAAAIPFGWDNERPAFSVDVPPFSIERHDVTNAAFLEFVAAGGYEEERWWRPEDWAWVRAERIRHPLFWEHDGSEWRWRGMFERLPLPLAWPVHVSWAEASAYARWRGARLPSEAEYQRAAYGDPDGRERHFPWGSEAPTAAHAAFDFSTWDPRPAGSCPRGQSAWGIHDLVGNGWEWTASPFGPFPGFQPMASYPEYSADFFDGDHFVMKGASQATPRELIRPTFRNWFRARYPYAYATFRCARDSR